MRLRITNHNLLLSAAAIVLVPTPSIARPRNPSQLVVVNESEGTLSLIDPRSGAEAKKLRAGGFAAHEAAVSQDGRYAFLPIYGDSNAGMPGTDGREVVKLDLRTGRIVARAVFKKGVRPHHAVMNTRDGLLYVTTELDHSVSVINPTTMKIVGRIPTGQVISHMLAISSDGGTGYVSNIGSGSISVIDLRRRRLIKVIPVSAKVQRVAIAADDKTVFTADQTSSRIAMIDAASQVVRGWIDLPAPGMGLTTTQDGRWLLVAIERPAKLAIVDLATERVVHLVDLPDYPHETIVSPDGATAFVSLSGTDQVARVSTADWSVKGIFKAGGFPDGLAWKPKD